MFIDIIYMEPTSQPVKTYTYLIDAINDIERSPYNTLHISPRAYERWQASLQQNFEGFHSFLGEFNKRYRQFAKSYNVQADDTLHLYEYYMTANDSNSFDTDELDTLPNGAKQSKLNVRMDLLPARATRLVGVVLKEGAIKYGEENWRGIPVQDHLNHALQHVFAYLDKDLGNDMTDLSHATTRLLFALELAALQHDDQLR